MTRRRIIRGLAVVSLGSAGIVFTIAVLLPALARGGYAGAVIQKSYDEGRDASALFYTESDRAMEILRELNQEEASSHEQHDRSE